MGFEQKLNRRDFGKLVGLTSIGTGVVLPFPTQAAPYAPVKITYRADGPWGPGKGKAMSYTEVDSNFYVLAQRLEELEKKYAELLSR